MTPTCYNTVMMTFLNIHEGKSYNVNESRHACLQILESMKNSRKGLAMLRDIFLDDMYSNLFGCCADEWQCFLHQGTNFNDDAYHTFPLCGDRITANVEAKAVMLFHALDSGGCDSDTFYKALTQIK